MKQPGISRAVLLVSNLIDFNVILHHERTYRLVKPTLALVHFRTDNRTYGAAALDFIESNVWYQLVVSAHVRGDCTE